MIDPETITAFGTLLSLIEPRMANADHKTRAAYQRAAAMLADVEDAASTTTKKPILYRVEGQIFMANGFSYGIMARDETMASEIAKEQARINAGDEGNIQEIIINTIEVVHENEDKPEINTNRA